MAASGTRRGSAKPGKAGATADADGVAGGRAGGKRVRRSKADDLSEAAGRGGVDKPAKAASEAGAGDKTERGHSADARSKAGRSAKAERGAGDSAAGDAPRRAGRAWWQGQIRLALVSIPVEIYPATRSGAAVSFRQIHEPSGKPVHYEKVVEGVGPVDRDEILKGYEVSRGHYVLLEDAEIEAVRIESKRTLELVQFVAAGDIDVLYYEKPYFVVPADALAEEAYVVLREALKASGKVALGQLAVRGREQLVALKPCGRGLVLEVLRYADEVQKARGAFKAIPDEAPDPDLLDLATTLIDRRTAPFHPDEFHDRYVEAIHRLVEKKAAAKGARVLEEEEAPAAARGGNVIDLMAALRRSLDDMPPAAPKDAKPAGKPRKRA